MKSELAMKLAALWNEGYCRQTHCLCRWELPGFTVRRGRRVNG